MTDIPPHVTTILNNHTKVIRAVAWLLAACAVALLIWRSVLPAMRSNSFAFSVYYTSARLTLQGQADTRICSEWFYEQQHNLGFSNRADAFCGFGLPTMALVMTPIAWLSPNIARIVWVLLDLGMIAIICVLAWRICEVKGWLTPRAAALFIPGALVLIVSFQPLNAEIRVVQIHIFIALLYALWFYGYTTQRDWLCGMALAGLAVVKLAGLPLWVFMLVCKRWRALAWAIGSMLAVVLITLPLFSLEFWLLDLQKMFALTGRPENAVPAFQTIMSPVRQTLVYDPAWSPRPLLNAPWLVTPVVGVIAIGLIAVTLWASRKGDSLLPAMAMMCLIVPLQPSGEQYHYSLLFVILLVLIASLEHWYADLTSVVLLGIVLILFALPSYFLRTASFNGFPVALLAYPRLYGTLILWCWLIYKSARQPGGNL